MAFEQAGATRGFIVAGADLSAAQYRAVTLNGSGQAVRNSTAGGRIYAVLQNNPASGRACTLWRSGVTKMVAGAEIDAGEEVQSDDEGRAIPAAVGSKNIIGVCVFGAGAAGQLCSVDLEYRGVTAAT
jgi:hypothetical protein